MITGGLGGIGHTIAKTLAQQFKAKLVLINRTPLPNPSEWTEWLINHGYDDSISRGIKKVRELEQLGAEVLVLAADVTDFDRMTEVVRETESKYGQINGVIHGAGVINDGLIQMKTQGDIEQVFAPKIYGTLVLDDVFKGKSLDFFALFSSTSTIISPMGQIDYVAANAFLNAFACYRNSTQPGYTVALNWGVWNEVGMAASSAAEMGYGITNQQQEEVVEARYPLFDKHIQTSNNGRDIHYLNAYLNSQQHWLLNEHRTNNGQALLPGTAYIELARAALDACGEYGAFEIKELIFLQALYVADDTTQKTRVKLQQTVEGYDFSIQSEHTNTGGDCGWLTHAEARIIIGSKVSPDLVDIFSVMERLGLPEMRDSIPDAQRTSQEAHLNFGPRWQLLREARYSGQESVAFLALDDQYHSDLEVYNIHPAMLDIATGYAMRLIAGYADSADAEHLWVPVSYGHFKCHKPLTQQLYSWVRNAASNTTAADFASFDIDLL